MDDIIRLKFHSGDGKLLVRQIIVIFFLQRDILPLAQSMDEIDFSVQPRKIEQVCVSTRRNYPGRDSCTSIPNFSPITCVFAPILIVNAHLSTTEAFSRDNAVLLVGVWLLKAWYRVDHKG